jgi:hypothetical protein
LGRSSLVKAPQSIPVKTKTTVPKLKKNQVQLIASGDLRLSANQVCWPAQEQMEATLTAALQGGRLRTDPRPQIRSDRPARLH